jgi:hypothetical protein
VAADLNHARLPQVGQLHLSWARKTSEAIAAESGLQRLLQPRPNFQVHTPRHLIASALWDYGVAELANRALVMSEQDRQGICRIEAWYESPSYPLPMPGQRITHDHVSAFAAITFFEGKVRPLAQTWRRPQRARPAIFDGDEGR